MRHDGAGLRVVVAPDTFKGCLSALDVADALAEGLREALPAATIVRHPIADGGEGTVDLALRNGYSAVTVPVSGPLGGCVVATYAMRDGVAVLELAAAAGLSLLGRPPDTDTAARASTRGVGEMILDALDNGAHEIVLGVGGSATTDGGLGLVQALGVRVTDAEGTDVGPGGGSLARVASIDASGLDARLRDVALVIACDVDNPLTGAEGAAAVYGPQKGADPDLVVELDHGLSRWADLVAAAVGHDARSDHGTGAAGGTAFAASTVLGAHLASGVQTVMALTGFADALRGADLLIVGEGSFDGQSLRGKGPIGLASAARAASTRVVAVVGQNLLDEASSRAAGVDAVYALTDIESRLEVCMGAARPLLRRLVARVVGDWRAAAVGRLAAAPRQSRRT